jgi:hypothetical protein
MVTFAILSDKFKINKIRLYRYVLPETQITMQLITTIYSIVTTENNKMKGASTIIRICDDLRTLTCLLNNTSLIGNKFIRKAATTSSVRFEVFTAVTMKNGVFWDVMPCGSWRNRRFAGT